MIIDLEQIQNLVFQKLSLIISHLQPDPECKEYFGHSFRLDQISIKFRKAKLPQTKSDYL